MDKQIIYGFILYLLYVLVPLLPSIIIYKMFPTTTVGATGLLGNLKINTTGAFSAYIITVILGHFIIQKNQNLIDHMENVAWEVSTKIELQDSEGKKLKLSNNDLKQILQIKTNPDHEVKDRSGVVFMAYADGELPKVIFSYGKDFESVMVNLASDTIEKNEDKRKINIGKVVLKRWAEKDPYKYRPTTNINDTTESVALPIPIGSGPPTLGNSGNNP